jgi:hypothetical protein
VSYSKLNWIAVAQVGFSIPQALSFQEGFSYTKKIDYLAVIVDVSGVFNSKTQLNDALIESYVDVCF